jgi:GNAT superfamily N-acetyltransferase
VDAVADGTPVGLLSVDPTPFGLGELGMLVAAEWRGRGVETAPVAAAIEWARERGLHKLTLGSSPTTTLRSRSTASSGSSRRAAAAATSDATAASSGT